jgi:hypothetical protein
MQISNDSVPLGNYGVLAQDMPASEIDETAEEVIRIGYSILDSGYSEDELKYLSEAFNLTRANYLHKYGGEYLQRKNEYHTIRAPLAHGDPVFISLATNSNLLNVLNKLIQGKFILNQQNGIVNPPKQHYNQSDWHRDLPYQHFVSNTPLAINALYCVDDFTFSNGSTFVLPATHKMAKFPSDAYIKKNALQLQARAGQYILLDCMLFHCGGFNRTDQERRGVNHIYTIPYIKQQINLHNILKGAKLAESQRELFGFTYQEPRSIEQYHANR